MQDQNLSFDQAQPDQNPYTPFEAIALHTAKQVSDLLSDWQNALQIIDKDILKDVLGGQE